MLYLPVPSHSALSLMTAALAFGMTRSGEQPVATRFRRVLTGEGRRAMSARHSFHEDLGREHKAKGASDRGFGLTFALFFAAVFILKIWRQNGGWVWWGSAAGLSCAVALLRPAVLAPLNRLWTRLGLLLFKVTSPVILGLLFVSTIVPIGLALRSTRRDLLQRKFDRQAATYWIPRHPPGPSPKSMENQF